MEHGTETEVPPPAAGGRVRPPRRAVFALGAVFAALVLADFLWIAPHLLVSDLNLDYPFVDGDSWDWIANGLAFAGHPVRTSGRPPLVPLLLAALERLGAMPLFPVLVQALVHGTALAFFAVAARRYGPRAALAAGVALLFNHSCQSLSLDLMADVAASCLLFGAAAAFFAAGQRPRAYAAAGLLGALSALTQQTAFLLPLPAAAAVLLRRRAHLRSAWLWAGAALFVAPPLAWLAWKRLAFGTAGDVLVRQWGLLRLHDGGSAAFYLWSLASLLGLPGLLLLVAGLVLAARSVLRRDPDAGGELFAAALTVLLFLFFAFAYDFQAKRFLVYGYWVGGLLIAAALGRLRHRFLFWPAAGLLVAGSMLPLPAPGRDPTWVGLWPLPPVYARGEPAAAAGGETSLLATIRLGTAPVRDLARSSNHLLVRTARPAAPAPRLDPAGFAADRGALYLYAPAEAGERYRTVTRLGNAVRRPMKFLPASWLEPHLGRWRAAFLGRVAEAAVYRVSVRGLDGTWLLLVRADGTWAARLAAGGAAESAEAAGAPEEVTGREQALELARAVASEVAESDAFVALLPGEEAGLADLYLPLVLATTEVHVIEPAGEPAARAFLAGLPRLGDERRFGPLQVRKIEVFGRPSAIVEPVRGAAEPTR